MGKGELSKFKVVLVTVEVQITRIYENNNIGVLLEDEMQKLESLEGDMNG
jgi:hypothetical protein